MVGQPVASNGQFTRSYIHIYKEGEVGWDWFEGQQLQKRTLSILEDIQKNQLHNLNVVSKEIKYKHVGIISTLKKIEESRSNEDA